MKEKLEQKGQTFISNLKSFKLSRADIVRRAMRRKTFLCAIFFNQLKTGTKNYFAPKGNPLPLTKDGYLSKELKEEVLKR